MLWEIKWRWLRAAVTWLIIPFFIIAMVFILIVDAIIAFAKSIYGNLTDYEFRENVKGFWSLMRGDKADD